MTNQTEIEIKLPEEQVLSRQILAVMSEGEAIAINCRFIKVDKDFRVSLQGNTRKKHLNLELSISDFEQFLNALANIAGAAKDALNG